MQQAAARVLEQLLVPLGPLLPEVVLVGGAAIPLWIDSTGAPPARATNDTDVIVAARSRVHYHQIGERLRQLDFGEVSGSEVICRWRHRPTGALYDVMPLDPDILGFSNEWYEEAFDAAIGVVLPDGTALSVATPPYLVATKLVAFRDRGGGDHLGRLGLGGRWVQNGSIARPRVRPTRRFINHCVASCWPLDRS